MDIEYRINKARITFIQLNKILRSGRIEKKKKLRIVDRNVRSMLKHECESWKMRKRIVNKLLVFLKCLRRRIIGVR